MIINQSKMLTLTTNQMKLVENLVKTRLSELIITDDNPSIIKMYQDLYEKVKEK